MLKDLLVKAGQYNERSTTASDAYGHDVGTLRIRGLIHNLPFTTEDHEYMIIIDNEGIYIGDGDRNAIFTKNPKNFEYKWSSEQGRFPSYKDYVQLDKELETVHSPESIAKFLAKYKITKSELSINGGKFTGDKEDVDYMQSIWDAIK